MTAPAPKKRRGRETVLDMLRSLAVVFAVIIPIVLLYRATPSESKRIRPVDPTEALQAFVEDLRGPIPHGAPPGWVVNVATEDRVSVRVGYVVGDHYAEFAGGRGAQFLEDATGRGKPRGTVTVAGTAWRDYLSADGRESLVRDVAGVTVLVGGVREDLSRAQLEQLAALVR